MEKAIDNMLENIFGGFNLQLNIIIGALLIIAGIAVLSLSKRPLSGGKIAVGWVCIGIGCLGILSGIAQLMLHLQL